MIVPARLHVSLTESIHQVSTITLAPRCSHASDSAGPAMVEFLSDPFIPCNLRPKYLKTGGVYPFFTTCSKQPEGGGPWASGEAPSQGMRPFAVAQGASHPAFLGGWWGHVVPNPQKSYLRLVLHRYMVVGGCGCTPVPREKKSKKTAKQSFQPSWTEFLQGPYLQTGMRTPLFFAFIAKSTSNSTQKFEKTFFSFFGSPPPRKNFSGHAIIKITQTEEFSVFIS